MSFKSDSRESLKVLAQSNWVANHVRGQHAHSQQHFAAS